MARSSAFVACTLVALTILVLPTQAMVHEFWFDDVGTAGQRAGCHLEFRETNDCLSIVKGIFRGTSLRKAHRDNIDIETTSHNCHGGTGTSSNQVRIDRSAPARDGVSAIGGMECHGRLEDANEVTFFGDGWGAGLPQCHSQLSNAHTAAACRDRNPGTDRADSTNNNRVAAVHLS